MTHICVSSLTINGSDNCLSPSLHHANKIQWNLYRNSYIFIQENSFENIVCKMVAILSQPHYINWVIICPGNGLSHFWHQAYAWTSAELVSVELRGTKSSIFSIKIWYFCIQQNALTHWGQVMHVCVGSDNQSGTKIKLVAKIIATNNDDHLCMGYHY